MIRTKLFRLAAVLAVSACATGAVARDWTVTVGGKVSTAPPYEGADRYVLRPSPTLSVTSDSARNCP